MPEPSPRSSSCPKCGSTDISMSYHKQGCSDLNCSCAECSWGSHHNQHDEHLHRHCRGCQYDWIDPVLVAA